MSAAVRPAGAGGAVAPPAAHGAGPSPRGTLDPGGLTGKVMVSVGLCSRSVYLVSGRCRVGRAVLLSPERLCRHVLVCGATGSGKTETLLRLAWAVAKSSEAPVFYLDGKGDRETARRFCGADGRRRPQHARVPERAVRWVAW